MKLTTLLGTLVVLALPTFAMASGCSGDHQEAAMICTDGTTWNADTKACVATTS